MAKTSAGILMYRQVPELQVLLVHPGGPFWAKKDVGAWSIPKGEVGPGEHPLDAAKREFGEETGCTVDGALVPLAPLKQRSGKVIHAWAVAGDCDPTRAPSNTFLLEWPPRSGVTRDFPEVDRAAWFPIPEARRRIIPGQVPFLAELVTVTAGEPRDPHRAT